MQNMWREEKPGGVKSAVPRLRAGRAGVMDIQDLRRVNLLWEKIYPHLVSQIMEGWKREPGSILELGPFSGGISRNLLSRYPACRIVIAAESPEVVAYMRQEVAVHGLSERIEIQETRLRDLAFDDHRFDLVIFRGAFFFLHREKRLLREIFRVLTVGGMAFIGGGFGKGTPKERIDEIAEESRLLNDRLGRLRISVDELKEMAEQAALPGTWTIEESGGLWLRIVK